jgi:hypothetical protein
VRIYVAYSFEIELPDELVDTMPEPQAKELARELAQNINFQEVQRAYTKEKKFGSDVYITKIRSTRIEDW